MRPFTASPTLHNYLNLLWNSLSCDEVITVSRQQSISRIVRTVSTPLIKSPSRIIKRYNSSFGQCKCRMFDDLVSRIATCQPNKWLSLQASRIYSSRGQNNNKDFSYRTVAQEITNKEDLVPSLTILLLSLTLYLIVTIYIKISKAILILNSIEYNNDYSSLNQSKRIV